jgi:inhibitor of KinA sporulation pathway (predicted exonuclease)
LELDSAVHDLPTLYLNYITRIDFNVDVRPGFSKNFDATLRRHLTYQTLHTHSICSTHGDLHFALDLDLDLHIVHEIFKVEVKTLTSFFSETVRVRTLKLDQNIVLNKLSQLPGAQGRGAHRGAAEPPQISNFKRFYLVTSKYDLFYCFTCCCGYYCLSDDKLSKR